MKKLLTLLTISLLLVYSNLFSQDANKKADDSKQEATLPSESIKEDSIVTTTQEIPTMEVKELIEITEEVATPPETEKPKTLVFENEQDTVLYEDEETKKEPTPYKTIEKKEKPKTEEQPSSIEKTKESQITPKSQEETKKIVNSALDYQINLKISKMLMCKYNMLDMLTKTPEVVRKYVETTKLCPFTVQKIIAERLNKIKDSFSFDDAYLKLFFIKGSELLKLAYETLIKQIEKIVENSKKIEIPKIAQEEVKVKQTDNYTTELDWDILEENKSLDETNEISIEELEKDLDLLFKQKKEEDLISSSNQKTPIDKELDITIEEDLTTTTTNSNEEI